MVDPVDVGFEAGPYRVEVQGITQGSKLMLERIRRLQDFRPLWRRNTLDFQRIEEAWFRSQGKGTWKALAESTQRARTRKLRKRRDGTDFFGGSGYYAKPSDQGPARLILVWTGDGRDSLTIQGVPGSEQRFDRDSMTFGTSDPKMVYNDPRRPVLDTASIQAAASANAREWVFSVLAGRQFDERRSAVFG